MGPEDKRWSELPAESRAASVLRSVLNSINNIHCLPFIRGQVAVAFGYSRRLPGYPEAFPGQMRCIIPSEDSGSAPGSPENLQREASRRDPDQMPEPPIRSTQRSSGSNPSTATIRRTLISSTCIHHLVLWVTTHSSWPQVRVGLVNWDLHLPVQILLQHDGPVSKPPVQLMLHCSIPEKDPAILRFPSGVPKIWWSRERDRAKANVTLTFDLWPPTSNQFIHKSKKTFVPNLKKFPWSTSWDITFTGMRQTYETR